MTQIHLLIDIGVLHFLMNTSWYFIPSVHAEYCITYSYIRFNLDSEILNTCYSIAIENYDKRILVFFRIDMKY